MRGPHISSSEITPLERLLARWPRRYALSVVLVALAAMLVLATKGAISPDAYVLMLFSAILLSGTLGGFGPGMIATALAFVAGTAMDITTSRMQELAMEGVLVSVLGCAFRTERMRATERRADNLSLEQQILEIGEEERRRIGHDLHDGLGQHLTGISLLSETLAQELKTGRPANPVNVERITDLVREAVRITRDLAKSLSPVTLEIDGFVAAVQELATTSSALLGINCTCQFDVENVPLDSRRALHLFRIVQEAVNNAVRHGKAREVCIGCYRANDEIEVTVTDDGSGLSTKTMSTPGLGLRIMQYRSRMLGALLKVERLKTTGGTIVTCICPLEAALLDTHEPAHERPFVTRTQRAG